MWQAGFCLSSNNAGVSTAWLIACLSLRRTDNRENLEADISREKLDDMGLDIGDEVGIRLALSPPP